MMAAGLLIMTTISDAHTPALVALFILVYGLGYGGTIPVSMAIVGEYFGRRSYGTIQGLSNAVGMTGTFIGPLVAGYTFDVTQNYVWALIAFAAVTLAGLPLFWLVRRPSMGAPKPSASTPSVGG
jgi:MFS family permease